MTDRGKTCENLVVRSHHRGATKVALRFPATVAVGIDRLYGKAGSQCPTLCALVDLSGAELVPTLGALLQECQGLVSNGKKIVRTNNHLRPDWHVVTVRQETPCNS